jgi:hypothetical protein
VSSILIGANLPSLTYLQQEFPEIKGFSVRNLELMRKWYRYWTQSDEITKQVVGQSHVVAMVDLPIVPTVSQSQIVGLAGDY